MQRHDDRPVVVFDLDGTVLRINSFPRWVVFLIIGRVRGLGVWRRMVLSLQTLALLLQRKLGHMRHDDFVRRLQSAWHSARAGRPDATLARFEAALLRRVRPNMAAALELVATRQIDAVLATAAAEEYAVGLARRLGFQHALATASDRRRGEPANSGIHKRQQVFAFLDGQGWRHRPMVLFTDHVDDWPLVCESHVVFWCGSPDAHAANTGLVLCREMDAAEIAARLSAACQPERLAANTLS